MKMIIITALIILVSYLSGQTRPRLIFNRNGLKPNEIYMAGTKIYSIIQHNGTRTISYLSFNYGNEFTYIPVSRNHLLLVCA